MATPRLPYMACEQMIAPDLRQRQIKLDYTGHGCVRSDHEAMQHIPRLRLDLMLPDRGLPGGLEGIEVAAHGQMQRDIPIISLTRSLEPELHPPTGAAPPDLAIRKPGSNQASQQTIQLALATADHSPRHFLLHRDALQQPWHLPQLHRREIRETVRPARLLQHI